MAIRIGCGSWADDAYVGLLYPDGAPKDVRLGGYAHWFERVEVNASSYRTPSRDTLAAWADETPPGFLFDLKLHRAFSDGPQKAAHGPLIDRLLHAVQPLIAAKKLGAFLLTLSPRFGPDRHQLDELDLVAEKLTPHAPLAVELRDRAWVDGKARTATLDYFRRRQLVWVALDLPRLEAPQLLPAIDEVTHPRLTYMRLHGRNPNYLKAKSAAERHHHDYTARELQEIATRIQTLATRAGDVHVSVNSHAAAFAPQAALALRRLLGQSVPPPLCPERLRPDPISGSAFFAASPRGQEQTPRA